MSFIVALMMEETSSLSSSSLESSLSNFLIKPSWRSLRTLLELSCINSRAVQISWEVTHEHTLLKTSLLIVEKVFSLCIGLDKGLLFGGRSLWDNQWGVTLHGESTHI